MNGALYSNYYSSTSQTGVHTVVAPDSHAATGQSRKHRCVHFLLYTMLYCIPQRHCKQVKLPKNIQTSSFSSLVWTFSVVRPCSVTYCTQEKRKKRVRKKRFKIQIMVCTTVPAVLLKKTRSRNLKRSGRF